MKKKNKKIIVEIGVIALVVVASTLFYYFFRSQSLDDYDSVQFAMGIDDYDISVHQPHPPGYPVYIFLLKCANYIFHDHLSSLLFWAIIPGGVGIGIFYLILRERFESLPLRVLLALVFAFIPLYSLNSEKALSDILSLTLYLGWILLYVRIKKSKASIYDYIGIGLVSGALAGVRIQLITCIIIPLILLFFSQIKIKPRQVIILTASCFAATLAWVIPSVIDAGDLVTYVKLMLGQYTWRFDIESHNPLANGFSIGTLAAHAMEHFFTFVNRGLGVTINYEKFYYVPRLLKYISTGIAGIIVSFIGWFSFRNRKDYIVSLFFFSCIPYAVFMYFNLNFENVRYWLQILPWLIILGGLAVNHFKNKVVKWIILVPIVVFFLYQSITLSLILHTEEPSPEKAVEYIQDKYEVDDVIFLNCAHMNFRHFQYLTNNEIPFVESEDEEEIEEYINDGKILVSCQCWKVNAISEDLESIDIKNFYRDLRVHWKHNFVQVCEVVNE